MHRDCCLKKLYMANSMLFLPTRLAPYERRVIELLRNSKDKRARKLAKKRVRIPYISHITIVSVLHIFVLLVG